MTPPFSPAAPDLGHRIRELRQARGLTQRELADAAGVRRGTVNNIERDANGTTLHTFLALCLALEVTPDEALGLKIGHLTGGCHAVGSVEYRRR